MANTMQYAGVIDSEQMMWGQLSDGRVIMVDDWKWENAPEDKRDDPEYWLTRLNTGEFDDPDNYPVVWTEKNGKREWRDFPRNVPDQEWQEAMDEYLTENGEEQ